MRDIKMYIKTKDKGEVFEVIHVLVDPSPNKPSPFKTFTPGKDCEWAPKGFEFSKELREEFQKWNWTQLNEIHPDEDHYVPAFKILDWLEAKLRNIYSNPELVKP